MKHAFANPVAESSLAGGFRLQSAPPSGGGEDAGKACDEKLDPMISQADAGSAALVAALAGAMAALQASTDNNKNQSPPSTPSQIVAAPDTGKPKTPGQDNLNVRAEPVGNAGFGTTERQVWNRGNDRMDSRTPGADARGTDQYASNYEGGGTGRDNLSASPGGGSGGGNDSLSLRPASLSGGVSGGAHGPALSESKSGLLAQSLSAGEGGGAGGGSSPSDVEGAYSRVNADPFLAQFALSRRPASTSSAASALKAGLSPQSGPSVFRIVTQTIKGRCLRQQLACVASRPG